MSICRMTVKIHFSTKKADLYQVLYCFNKNNQKMIKILIYFNLFGRFALIFCQLAENALVRFFFSLLAIN